MSRADGIRCLGWIALGLLLRLVLALGPHSGQGKPPLFGDYEAQRHWMEITTALPVQQWYEPSPDNDLQYWGLDYPPLTAFHSWLLGTMGHFVDPSCFALHTSRGQETFRCKAFMRLSVIASDLLIFLPGAVLAAKSFAERWHGLALLLWLLPPLVIIDHGHFQYNCVCLGLSLAAAGCVAQKRIVPASVLFTLSLLYKQISLYYAPAFFFGILSQCLRPFALDRAVLGVASAGAAVICTALLLFGPWLLAQYPLPALLQVLHRMFPFARGLYEDKVANFWCSISVVVKVQRLVPAGRLPLLCALTTCVALLPSALCTLRRYAGPGTFSAALFTSSISFFLFAFQVHEKGVLFPSQAVCLLPPAVPKEWRPSAWILVLHFQIVSLFSLYPLMVKDELRPAYLLSMMCLIAVTFALCKHAASTACSTLVLLSVLVGLLLHCLHALVPTPQRYPDIWTLLITGVSCGYFMLAFAVVTVAQLYGAFDTHKMHQKDE